MLIGLHLDSNNKKTTKDEHNLPIFERQIPRKIFGPVNIDNMWRIRNNMEIDKLMEGVEIVRFINLLAPEFYI